MHALVCVKRAFADLIPNTYVSYEAHIFLVKQKEIGKSEALCYQISALFK